MLKNYRIVGHLFGIIFVGLAIISLSKTYISGEVIRMTDTGNYLPVAFNLANSRHFGEDLDDSGYLNVEPTYPYYLAGIFLFSKDFFNVSLGCLDYRSMATACSSDSERERAYRVRLQVNKISFIIVCVLVIMVVYASMVVSNSWIVGYLSGVFMVIFLPHDGQELLTNVFLITHTLFGFLSYRNRNRRNTYSIVSGSAFGFLVLSAPIYLYYLSLFLPVLC